MPVLGLWLHPQSFVHVTRLEMMFVIVRFSLKQTVCKQSPFFCIANNLMHTNAVPYFLVSTSCGIVIAHENELVFLKTTESCVKVMVYDRSSAI